MLTGMGNPLLSNSYSIISNPKSLFNMNNYTHIIGDPSIEAYFRTFLQYAETKGFKLTEFEQTIFESQGIASAQLLLESTDTDDYDVDQKVFEDLKRYWKSIQSVDEIPSTKFYALSGGILIFSYSPY